MNRDPILFRVDGTRSGGYERLYRCLGFAAALQRRRRPTYVQARLDPSSLAFAVKRAGNEWLPADYEAGSPEDLAETLRQVRRLRPAAVVLDAACTPPDYLQELRSAGPRIVLMDHVGGREGPARLIINPLPAPGREAYPLGVGTQVLMGPRFALIRPEVRRARPLRSQEPSQPFRILVALGDNDPHQQTVDLARLLMNCPRVGRVDAIVRGHHPQLEPLQAMAEAMPGRFEVATEPPEVTARLTRCHLAVTAGNSWSVELACVGIPQLLIVQDRAHEPTARRLEEEGAAVLLGLHPEVAPATLRQGVQNMLADAHERQAMSRAGRRLVDGRGPDRLVVGLEILLQTKKPLAGVGRRVA